MGDRCFCIFEGGGARGIAHVGALAALEESGLKLDGFAGTSAGAIIAALAAVGYRSDDLINPDGTVLGLIDLDASNIWGADAVRPAHSPANLIGPLGWFYLCCARNLGLYTPHILLLLATLAVYLVAQGYSLPLLAVFLLMLVAALAAWAVAAWLSAGLASLASFERGLNQLLRLRLAGRIPGAAAHHGRLGTPVTFADLKLAGCPPLRVVAADISCQQLQLFSSDTTPDDGVASAVAASVCLPVIFKPWRIGDRMFLDGGLVSNLPAWTFDAERAVDRDAWTAVVQVGQPERPRALRGTAILKAAVMTGIFGSGLLNIRNVDRLKAVRLDVRLNLLQFDPGLDLANQVVSMAKARCRQELVYKLRDLPALMKDICSRIAIRASRTINLELRKHELPPFEDPIRVSIFVRTQDDPSSLTADFQHGFEHAPDERIRLPLHGSIVGEALRAKASLYLERRDPSWGGYLHRDEHRWLRKLICPRMNWVFCTPHVNAATGMELVVSVDSSGYLPLDVRAIDLVLATLAGEIRSMLDEFVPTEAFSNGST